MGKIIQIFKIKRFPKAYNLTVLMLFVLVSLLFIAMYWDYRGHYEIGELLMNGKLSCQDQGAWQTLVRLSECWNEMYELQEAFLALLLGNIIVQAVFYILFWAFDRLYGRFRKL